VLGTEGAEVAELHTICIIQISCIVETTTA
jgi:hypothetical protein